jgi:hypothetical protein
MCRACSSQADVNKKIVRWFDPARKLAIYLHPHQ